ncbi:ABC-F family ATP-binding cassette domain-containing protein [Pediococcus acidilactici]
MGIIQIKNLSYSYDQQVTPLFEKVDLEIDARWKLGLIGRNGRGKTTLLKILRGQVPYQGQVNTDLQFNYFPAKIPNPQATLENVLMKITQRDYSNFGEVEREMDRIGLPNELLTQPYGELSPGQRIKAQLAAMFANAGAFQLIDEPTNHLDEEGRQRLADYLKRKQGFIVVSHDRDFLNQVIDHVIAIDRAQITSLHGNYTTWATERQRADERERRTKETLQKEVKQLTKAAQQKQNWSKATEREKVGAADKGFVGHKAAKIMKRATMIQARAEAKVADKQRLLKNIEIDAELQLNYNPPRLPANASLLTVNQLVVSRGNASLNLPVSFELKNDDRIVLQGPNGVGKSTLIAAILGNQELRTAGTVSLRNGLKVSYLPQAFDELSGDLASFAQAKAVDLQDLLATLRKLGFERELFTQRIEQMSMGQKRKVALARALCEPANLYIWDEPLNYLDVITREQIQQLILRERPAMLIIDHDREFVRQVNTQIVEITPGF